MILFLILIKQSTDTLIRGRSEQADQDKGRQAKGQARDDGVQTGQLDPHWLKVP